MSNEKITFSPGQELTIGKRTQPRRRLHNGLYIAATPPIILLDAARNRKEAPTKKFSDAVEIAERKMLQKRYGLTFNEPGNFLTEFSDAVLAVVPESLQNANPEGAQFVEETAQAIQDLGGIPKEKIRKARRSFKRIPDAHVKTAVKGVGYAPIKKTLRTLEEKTHTIDPTINPEIIDVISSFLSKETDDLRGAGGLFDRKTQSVEFVDGGDLLSTWANAHETGHGVYDSILTDEQREQWHQLSKGSITTYAEKVTKQHRHTENFSEMYALYLLGGPLLKIWSKRDEDIAAQYKFFTSFMPKEPSRFPTLPAIMYMLQEKVLQKSMSKFEKGMPLSDMIDDMTNVYDPTHKEQQFSNETQRKLFERTHTMIFGNTPVKPEELRAFLAYHQIGEFCNKNLPLLHDSSRVKEFFVKNGTWQQAVATRDELSNRAVDLDVALELCDMDVEKKASMHYAFPVFLKDDILFITAEGKEFIPYRQEIKEQIEIEAASDNDDIDKIISPLARTEQDAIRAVVEPTEEDREAKKAFAEKYQIPLVDSNNRAFSEQVVTELEQVLEKIPVKDRERIKGFYRIRFNGEENKQQRKKIRRGYIPVDDLMISGAQQSLEQSIIKNVAFSVISKDPTLFEQFKEAGEWEKVKLGPIRKTVFAATIGRYENNPIVKTRITDKPQSSFLSPFEPINIGYDFVSCYSLYALNNERFREHAQSEPTLQAKYDVIASHFSTDASHPTATS